MIDCEKAEVTDIHYVFIKGPVGAVITESVRLRKLRFAFTSARRY